jgi:hypothetical protein
MLTRKVVAAVLGLGIVATPPVRADERSTVEPPSPGTRVRYEIGAEWRETATVVEADGDALVVRLGRNGAVVRVPLAEMRHLEVSAGLRSNADTGAIVGAVPGVLFGGYIGLAACYESDCAGSGIPAAALGAFIVGTLSGLIGAAIGSLIKTERWKPLSLPRTEIQLAPTRQGGLAVGFKVSF